MRPVILTRLLARCSLHHVANPLYLHMETRVSELSAVVFVMCKDDRHFHWSGRIACEANEELRVSSVEEKVIGIVSEQLNVPKEDIRIESSFIDDLKADSLDIVELVMELEDEFDVSIPDDDYEKIKTVGDAVKYIQEKQ